MADPKSNPSDASPPAETPASADGEGSGAPATGQEAAQADAGTGGEPAAHAEPAPPTFGVMLLAAGGLVAGQLVFAGAAAIAAAITATTIRAATDTEIDLAGPAIHPLPPSEA